MGNFSKRNPGEGDDGKSPPANEPTTLCSTIIAFLFILGFTVYYAVQNIRNNNLSMAAFYRRPSLREGDFVDKLGLMILFFVILIIIAAALFHLAIIIKKRAEDIMKRVKAIQTRRRQNQD